MITKLEHIDILVKINRLVKKDSGLLYANSLNDYTSEPIGDGNPYYMCSYCGNDDPLISYAGHASDCDWKYTYETFTDLKSKLPKEVQDNLLDYLDEL